MKTGISLQVFGDWTKCERLLADLSSHHRPITRDAARAGSKFVHRFKERLIDGIWTNGATVGLVWAPVSSKYAKFKWKTFRVPASDLLRASYTYIQELTNLEITQNNYIVSMQFRRGALERKAWRKGIKLRYYSQLMEFGGENFIARPLWHPAFRSIGGYENLTRTMTSAIQKRLQRLDINIRFNF